MHLLTVPFELPKHASSVFFAAEEKMCEAWVHTLVLLVGALVLEGPAGMTLGECEY